jgi:hypothetical protein
MSESGHLLPSCPMAVGGSLCPDSWCAPKGTDNQWRKNPPRTIGVPPIAIFYLAAFRTPAARARGWSRHSGVRKHAQEETLKGHIPRPLQFQCFYVLQE